MKKLFSFAALSLLAFGAFAQAPQGRLSGRRAPGFSLMDINYNQHDLMDYRGKVVVIDFIRTDCPMCNTFAGVAERVREKFGDDVAVLTIVNAPPDSLKTVGEFIEKHNVKVPILFDTFNVAASYLKLTPVNPQFTLPHLFLITRTGEIQNDYEYDGSNDAIFSGTAAPLMAEIEKMVKSPQAVPTAKPRTASKKE